MSLGDYLRLLRAKRGGITPWDIESATNLPKGLYRQIEQRYRPMGDEEAVRTLADFYGVSYEDLRWRHNWPRKALSRSLVACKQQQMPITLHLWNGEEYTGYVRWWDLGAIGLAPAGAGQDVTVIQRHAVERWDPRVEPASPGDDEEDEHAG